VYIFLVINEDVLFYIFGIAMMDNFWTSG